MRPVPLMLSALVSFILSIILMPREGRVRRNRLPHGVGPDLDLPGHQHLELVEALELGLVDQAVAVDVECAYLLHRVQDPDRGRKIEGGEAREIGGGKARDRERGSITGM